MRVATRLTPDSGAAIQGLILATASLSLAAPAAAFAQSLPYGECRTGYWSSNRNLDNTGALASSACLVDWKAQPADNLRAAGNLRLQHGARAGDTDFRARLREGYLRADADALTVKLGRQIIVWGRSDRISPTDVLGSRDFTFRSGDDDEQRNGSDALSLRWQASEAFSVTAIVARFEGNRLPTGQLPDTRVDGPAPTRAEFGVRIDRSGPGLDASLSYFDGFDKARRYWFGPVSGASAPGGPVFQSSHERLRMVGADFATSAGRWTLRGEVAHFRATPQCGDCPLPERKIDRAVIGVDRDLFDTANINLQFFGVRRSHYQSPDNSPPPLAAAARGLDRLNGEFGAIERGATVRVANRFLNDKLRVEVSGIFDLSHSSQLWRGRITHSFDDHLKVNLGVDHFRGPEQSFLGSRVRNNAAWLELALVF